MRAEEPILTRAFPLNDPESCLNLDGPLRLLPPPANLAVALELDMLGLLPLVKPNTSLRSLNRTLQWSETRLRQVAATLIKNGILEVGSQPVTLVEHALVIGLQQAFMHCAGLNAPNLWTNCATRLGVNPEALAIARFVEFLRLLADSIDEPTGKSRFIEAISLLRKQHMF